MSEEFLYPTRKRWAIIAKRHKLFPSWLQSCFPFDRDGHDTLWAHAHTQKEDELSSLPPLWLVFHFFFFNFSGTLIERKLALLFHWHVWHSHSLSETSAFSSIFSLLDLSISINFSRSKKGFFPDELFFEINNSPFSLTLFRHFRVTPTWVDFRFNLMSPFRTLYSILHIFCL